MRIDPITFIPEIDLGGSERQVTPIAVPPQATAATVFMTPPRDGAVSQGVVKIRRAATGHGPTADFASAVTLTADAAGVWSSRFDVRGTPYLSPEVTTPEASSVFVDLYIVFDSDGFE